MTRAQLEHVIGAAAAIADDGDIVVLGSQAILGSHPDAPAPLLRSMAADVGPRNHPERWELIDGAIGEGSQFHDTFGYYARGIEERTAVLPSGWQSRLVLVCNDNTRFARGWTLEPHDLVAAKLIAGRDKDVEFATEAAAAGLVDPALLLRRLEATAVAAQVAALTRARIAALRTR